MAKKRRPNINLAQPLQPQSGDLEKLFATADDVEQAAGLQLLALRIDAIRPDPYQPRRTFPEESLQELSESIRQDGVIQPIEVTQTGPSQFMIVHGERRWRAAQMAGLDAIPAVVRRRDYDEVTRFVRQLVENLQREDLNDVDRAYGMVRLRDLMQEELDAQVAEGMVSGKPHSKTISWAKVSERLGFTRQRASQLIQLLDLPEEIKDAVRQGQISERDTRVLKGLKPSQQRALYRALEAGDVTPAEYKQVARYLKNEAPEQTVHEAIRIMHQPLPPARPKSERGFDISFEEDERGGRHGPRATDRALSPALPQPEIEPDEDVDPPSHSIRIDNIKRLDYVRGHLARVQRRGLSTAERREILRLLYLIQDDVVSLIAALKSDEGD
ncbi:MAG TPA: ParB/RepB/Spo0J family partition protein [Anaerolineae bacterium]